MSRSIRPTSPSLRTTAAALGLLGATLAAPTCRAEAEASSNLPEVIASAAGEILKLTKEQPLSVGQFTAVGLPDANGGPAIGELLRAALERLRPGSVRARGA